MRSKSSRALGILIAVVASFACTPATVSAQDSGMGRSTYHVQDEKLPKRPAVKTDLVLEDITASTGIHFEHHSAADAKFIIESMSGGVALIDYDRDGWPDIFFTGSLTVEEALQGK
jgi:hypothetical protein